MNKERWQRSLDEAVEELLVKGNLKAPIEVFEVGRLPQKVLKFYNELTGQELETLNLVLSKSQILHFRPARKNAYDQALRLEEIRGLVTLLEKNQDYFFDKKSKKDILIFWEDEKDATKLNKVVITLAKMKREDFRTFELKAIR